MTKLATKQNKKVQLTPEQFIKMKEQGLTVAQVTGKAPIEKKPDNESISPIKLAVVAPEKVIESNVSPIEITSTSIEDKDEQDLFVLTEEQEAVADKIYNWYTGTKGYGEFQFAGFAGVGKSTVIQHILKRLPLQKGKVHLSAPTGTASLVLADKTPGYEFSTNHSLFYTLEQREDGSTYFSPSSEAIWDLDLVVMDEASMSGSKSGNDILNMCQEADVKILIVGDNGQLEPVNDGQEFFLLKPDAILTKVMRQAAENPIIKLSMKIREATEQGRPYMIPTNKQWNVDNKVFLRSRRDISPAMFARVITKGGAIISGLNKTRKAYNTIIRKELGFTEPQLMEGETVVIKENLKEDSKEDLIPLSNGMRGIATEISRKPNGLVSFKFTPELFGGSRVVECNEALLFERITLMQLKEKNKELESQNLLPIPIGVETRLGYVITAHGSQGAQWPIVFVFDESSSFGWKDKAKGYISKNRWLYTAVTRASEQLMILN